VRTAIAVMAFGFLVAKFDLFLKIAARLAPATVKQSRCRAGISGRRWGRADYCRHGDGGAHGGSVAKFGLQRRL
jgi:hypothetical protein